jgi:starvation-inducible DNA-binding protein
MKTTGVTRAKSYPPPRELATPTVLTPHEVRAVTEAVNPLIADAFALYVKTKSFHWHVYGPHFNDYHRLFDEQAEAIFDSIDELAERVRKIGGTTIRSVGHIAQLQTIEDDNDELVSPERMIRRLAEDNGLMAKAIYEAILVCDKNRDVATSNILQDILDKTERRKWFLFETLQEPRRTN